MAVKTSKMLRVLSDLGFEDLPGTIGLMHKETKLIISLHKDKKEVPDVIYRATRTALDCWGVCTSHNFDSLTGY